MMRFRIIYEDGFSGMSFREISQTYGYSPNQLMKDFLADVLPHSVYELWIDGEISIAGGGHHNIRPDMSAVDVVGDIYTNKTLRIIPIED